MTHDSRNLAHVFSCIYLRTFCVRLVNALHARCIGIFKLLPTSDSTCNFRVAEPSLFKRTIQVSKIIHLPEAARKSRGACRYSSASLAEKRYEKELSMQQVLSICGQGIAWIRLQTLLDMARGKFHAISYPQHRHNFLHRQFFFIPFLSQTCTTIL